MALLQEPYLCKCTVTSLSAAGTIKANMSMPEPVRAVVVASGDMEVAINLVQMCETKGGKVVIGVYAKSHHTMWCSTNTNDRGEILDDWLLSSDLHNLNAGHRPTFITRVGARFSI